MAAEILKQQQQTGERIKQRANAYVSTPLERKTKAFIQERLKKLEEDWVQFNQNDKLLKEHQDVKETHLYFSTRYYETIEAIVIDYRDEMRKSLRDIEQHEAEQNLDDDVHMGNGKQQSIDPAILFRASSQMELNKSGMGHPDQVIENVKMYMNNLKELIQVHNDNEDEMDDVKAKAASSIILKKWQFVSNLHEKVALMNGYNPEEYFKLERSINKFILQSFAEKEEYGEASAKLPKLTMPKFEGDYLAWESFKQLFQRLIGKQKNLSKTEKLAYLKGQLDGEPKRLIASLPIQDGSYDSAWDILNERFMDQHMILQRLLDILSKGERMNGNSIKNMKEVYDAMNESITMIKNMEIPDAELIQYILYYFLEKKVDTKSLALYENTLTDITDLRTYDHFMKFMNVRIHHLSVKYGHRDEGQRNTSKTKDPQNESKKKVSIALVATKASEECCCKEKHKLYNCPKFLEKSEQERYKKVRELKRCINCLRDGHSAKDCKSRKCTVCQKAHNTLLHFNKSDVKTVLISQKSQREEGHIFLATVMVDIIDKYGKPIRARTLLDSCAQMNLVTDRMQKKLGLMYKRSSMELLGIGSVKTETRKRLNITIKSPVSAFTTNVEVHTLKQVATEQPQKEIDIKNWKIPDGIQLADAKFNIPAKVDLILGGELFFDLLMKGKQPIGDGYPTLQKTVFGWAVVGKLLGLAPQSSYVGIVTNETLTKQIANFWILEEKGHEEKPLTKLELGCEKFFKETTKRDEKTGKFIVKLQFTKFPSILGNSEKMAIRRFNGLEHRFKVNPSMKIEYVKFMQEYIELGHMDKIDKNSINQLMNYFIPHHGVVNSSSSTTKFRVVFDASAKTTNNIALNEILANGPMLQDDLFSIIARFRIHIYAFSADITKMYRQVEIMESDKVWQLIVWRENESDPLQYYKLNTLTYGTTCASYLAIKCLQTLAEESKEKYPLAAKIGKRDFNVDDVMSGANTVEEAVQAQNQLIKMCKEGHFELHKWCANNKELLAHIPKEKQEVSLDVNASKNETKALGIKWIPKDDLFQLSYSPQHHEKITKRAVLSEVTQLFDPLGVVNPVIVRGKIFMQDLWKMKLNWDIELSIELQEKWKKFRLELIQLKEINFPRKLIYDNHCNIQLHIFSDASMDAYGACFYLRTVNKEGKIRSHLICSKSRVAPVNPITLPRLELCGALIMVELAAKLNKKLGVTIEKVVYWTDSELVLSWVLNDGSYKTFVANRVSTIKEQMLSQNWNYINTKMNPADLLSRGVSTKELLNSKLWWHGPEFLEQSEETWPKLKPKFMKDPAEERTVRSILVVQQSEPHFIERINHKNSWDTLIRIVAYIMRIKDASPGNKYEKSLEIQNWELKRSKTEIIKFAQRQFDEELKLLKKGNNKQSKFSSLTPIIDEDGIIRVGGRLQKADIPDEQKHPALLPKTHPITRLIMEDTHKKNHHAGAQALLAFTRQNFWPESGRKMAKNIVKNCVLCTRSKPLLMQQIMGNLPSDRITPTRAFQHVSLDFLGPVEIHHGIRGKTTSKAYVCIFVCLATKAVHIEAAADISIDGFISCLKRFIARRSAPKRIICDNGTNFRGTHNQLNELYENINNEKGQQKINKYCQPKDIDWYFTPARSPHFNGLSEAAVKSAKQHLRKILHSTQIKYDELSTIVAEVEAILNSRPLTPMSNDPNDLQPLTPGHFLVGTALNAIDDRLIQHTSKTKMWHKLVAIRNQFWERWSVEYLAELQGKTKWRQEKDNIKLNQMVIIKKDNTRPLFWKIGRIVGVTKDESGIIRVVRIKVAKADASGAVNKKEKTVDPEKISIKTKVITRSIHQICLLPVDEKEPEIVQEKGEKLSQLNVEAEPFEPVAKRTRSKKTISNIILMACAFLALLSGIGAKKCDYTPFVHNPGLYFENNGKLGLSNEKWNIHGFIRMEGYWEQQNQIKYLMEKLKKLCPQLKTHQHCNVTVNIFQQQIDELIESNEIFRTFSQKVVSRKRRGVLSNVSSQSTKKNLSRQRRGWVNLIGTGLKATTGVMDDEDRKQINRQADEFKEQNKYLLQLIDNQTSIMDLTSNIIKQQGMGIGKQIEYLKRKVDLISNNITEDKGTIFTAMEIQISALIFHQMGRQQTIFDLITHIHHGKVSSTVINPTQLQQHLKAIDETIHSEVMIPRTKLGNNLAQIYSILTAQIQVTPMRILIKITLPLISRDVLQLYHSIPIPFQHNNSTRIITSTYQYIAVNNRQDRYYMLTAHQREHCKELGEEMVICERLHTVYNTQNGRYNCEMAIFTHEAKEISPKCTTKEIPEKQAWAKLNAPNKFLFYSQDTSSVNIICHDKSTVCTIINTGIISLPMQCTIHTDNLEIAADNIYNNIPPLIMVPAINITNVLDISEELQNNNVTEFQRFNLEQDLEILKQQIQKQRESIRRPGTVDIRYVHHFILLYVSVAILIIITSVFICRAKVMRLVACVSWCKGNRKNEKEKINNSQNPIPLPRLNREIDVELPNILPQSKRIKKEEGSDD